MKVVAILFYVLLILTVIGVAIQINRKINRQPDVIVEVVNRQLDKKLKEGFTTPAAAWNTAASFTALDNGLLTRAQNKLYKSDPYLLADRNAPRSDIPMNALSSSKGQIEIPDSNSVTGFRNQYKFHGQRNYSSSMRSPETSNLVEGANVKVEKVVEQGAAPTTVQKDNAVLVENKIAEEAGEDASEMFSFNPNSRANATNAQMFTMPSTAQMKMKLEEVKNKIVSKIDHY